MTPNELLPCCHTAVQSLLRYRNEKAFSDVYDTYAPALYGILLHRINDPDIACSMVRRVFVTAWQQMDQYESEQQRFFTWLLHIAARESGLSMHTLL